MAASSAQIHQAALAYGRAAEFLDADWHRVAPCHWKAVHQVGVEEAPYVLRVRLGEGSYTWDVAQDELLLATGEARTPMQGRSFARRAAQDLTATLPPAPMRRKSEPAYDDEASAEARAAIDRKVMPYLALGLLGLNVGFTYYGVAVGTAQVSDLLVALALLSGGSVLHIFWQSWD
jgi:hypothetical protein